MHYENFIITFVQKILFYFGMYFMKSKNYVLKKFQNR